MLCGEPSITIERLSFHLLLVSLFMKIPRNYPRGTITIQKDGILDPTCEVISTVTGVIFHPLGENVFLILSNYFQASLHYQTYPHKITPRMLSIISSLLFTILALQHPFGDMAPNLQLLLKNWLTSLAPTQRQSNMNHTLQHNIALIPQ